MTNENTTDDFNGDNAKLCECIDALLDLDAKGILVPHGVGGHARKMLAAAASRLRATLQAAPHGYKLVPIEPTLEMLSEAQKRWNYSQSWETATDCYRAMVAAARPT
jgi:hypothetical protein